MSTMGEPVVVIACGAAKLDRRAPAAELYTSPHFGLMLRAARRVAEQQAGCVLILSALHGLVECDMLLDPYDMKMGAAGAITPAVAPSAITTLLPRAYANALRTAAANAGAPAPTDLFGNARGIGYQRRVASRLISGIDLTVAALAPGHPVLPFATAATAVGGR